MIHSLFFKEIALHVEGRTKVSVHVGFAKHHFFKTYSSAFSFSSLSSFAIEARLPFDSSCVRTMCSADCFKDGYDSFGNTILKLQCQILRLNSRPHRISPLKQFRFRDSALTHTTKHVGEDEVVGGDCLCEGMHVHQERCNHAIAKCDEL